MRVLAALLRALLGCFVFGKLLMRQPSMARLKATREVSFQDVPPAFCGMAVWSKAKTQPRIAPNPKGNLCKF